MTEFQPSGPFATLEPSTADGSAPQAGDPDTGHSTAQAGGAYAPNASRSAFRFSCLTLAIRPFRRPACVGPCGAHPPRHWSKRLEREVKLLT